MNDVWLLLILIIPNWLLAFAVAETYALVTNRQTLTQWIRRQLGLSPAAPRRKWAAPLFAGLLGGFTLWFLPHILLGIWPS